MIDNYQFGKIVVNGASYENDIILFGDIVQAAWRRKKGHELCVADIQKSLDQFLPTVIVVGTGKFGLMKVLPETEAFLQSRQIRLVIKKTGEAIGTYNSLMNSENVLGAFHLTC